MDIIREYQATVVFTAPTAYRAMLAAPTRHEDLSSLRVAVSAGETLPAPIYHDWIKQTGTPILDGIGATEMLHIFISNRLDDHRPNCTGKPVAGYEARIVDMEMNDVPRGTVGSLPCVARQAADTWPISVNKSMWLMAGTSPAMRFIRMRRATCTSLPATTT
ncbi:hypothetical protein HSBAA_20320 [Vreelandella sulfidaeris]|uniref:AMP-dependent synthetase/ligase domain-containing protein n=1 Tax=Vreelandella sulfidaeris TaxID=115553 RepID=A0A455U3X6_9GAMM|nr:hypothetical protein HSBAA_20320 [Halomonas sulfidaeris]